MEVALLAGLTPEAKFASASEPTGETRLVPASEAEPAFALKPSPEIALAAEPESAPELEPELQDVEPEPEA